MARSPSLFDYQQQIDTTSHYNNRLTLLPAMLCQPVVNFFNRSLHKPRCRGRRIVATTSSQDVLLEFRELFCSRSVGTPVTPASLFPTFDTRRISTIIISTRPSSLFYTDKPGQQLTLTKIGKGQLLTRLFLLPLCTAYPLEHFWYKFLLMQKPAC